MLRRIAACVPVCLALTASNTAAAPERHAWTIPGVVRIAWGTEPAFDPATFATLADHILARLIHEPLFDIDSFGRLAPRLAVEVPTMANGGVTRDGLTIRYRLRSGAVFSDGSPVTANDVVQTVRAASANALSYSELADIRADGPSHLVVTLNRRSSSFVGKFLTSSGEVSYVLERGRAQPNGGDAYVGAGPYRVVSYRRGEGAHLAANERYYRGRPALNEIRITVLPDANNRRIALAGHEVDLLVGQATGNATTATSFGRDVRETLTPVPGAITIVYATWHAPFDDVRVRRAFDLALDRRQIADHVYLGQVLPATAYTLPGRWLDAPPHRALIAHVADAQRALEDAGWHPGADGIRTKNGRRLEVTLALQPAFERLAVALQAMYHTIGADVTLRSYPINLYFALPNEGGIVKGGRFDAAIVGDLRSSEPELSSELGCAAGKPLLSNNSRYCEAALSAALARLEAAPDDRARRTAYDAVRAILDRDLPVSYVLHPAFYVAANSDVHGIVMDSVGPFASAWQWRT